MWIDCLLVRIFSFEFELVFAPKLMLLSLLALWPSRCSRSHFWPWCTYASECARSGFDMIWWHFASRGSDEMSEDCWWEVESTMSGATRYPSSDSYSDTEDGRHDNVDMACRLHIKNIFTWLYMGRFVLLNLCKLAWLPFRVVSVLL